MNMKESFEAGKAQGRWTSIRISRAYDFPNSEIDLREFLTGHVLEVFDDYLRFALYDSHSDAKSAKPPVEEFNLSFGHVVTWDFHDRDILPLVMMAKSDAAFKQLRNTLRHMYEVEVFHSLFPIAVAMPRQNFGIAIAIASDLLFDLNPACPISCIEAIRAMLEDWDGDAGQVAYYLFKQFDMSPIQEAINQLRDEPLSDEQRNRLFMVEHWTQKADREGTGPSEYPL